MCSRGELKRLTDTSRGDNDYRGNSCIYLRRQWWLLRKLLYLFVFPPSPSTHPHPIWILRRWKLWPGMPHARQERGRSTKTEVTKSGPGFDSVLQLTLNRSQTPKDNWVLWQTMNSLVRPTVNSLLQVILNSSSSPKENSMPREAMNSLGKSHRQLTETRLTERRLTAMGNI